jgi:hypothetical protein
MSTRESMSSPMGTARSHIRPVELAGIRPPSQDHERSGLAFLLPEGAVVIAGKVFAWGCWLPSAPISGFPPLGAHLGEYRAGDPRPGYGEPLRVLRGFCLGVVLVCRVRLLRILGGFALARHARLSCRQQCGARCGARPALWLSPATGGRRSRPSTFGPATAIRQRASAGADSRPPSRRPDRCAVIRKLSSGPVTTTNTRTAVAACSLHSPSRAAASTTCSA